MVAQSFYSPNRKSSTKVTYVLLFLILCGACIRFYNLTYTGLWLDEIFSMKGADPSTGLIDVYEYSLHDQPPLFFVALQTWLKVFGYNDFAGRSLAVLFGLLGIPAIYFLGKEFKNETVGLFAAFLTTINWYHVGISVEIRFYALVFLLATLSYLFFLRSVKRSRILDFCGYALATGLLLNTHYFGMVLFATQVIIFVLIVIFHNRTPKFLIRSLIAGTIAALSLLHWLPVILQDLQISSFHVKPHTLRYLVKFGWWYFYDPVTFLICVILFLLGIREFFRNTKEKVLSVPDRILLGWIVFGFSIPLIYSFVRMPLFTGKYLTIQVPGIFVFVAYGFNSILNHRSKVLIVMAMTVSALVVLFVSRPPFKKSWHEDGREMVIMYFTMDEADIKTWNEDWREVAGFFAQYNSTNQVIFSQLAWYHEYYFRKNNLKPPRDQNVLSNFEAEILHADSVWLLIHNHYTGGWPITGFLPEQKTVMERDFMMADSVNFRLSKAFLFIRKE